MPAGTSGPGHADQRHAIEESAAPTGDPGTSLGRRRRRDEIDDREPGLPRNGLERGAFVGRQVGHDRAAGARPREAPGDGTTVAAAETWFA